MEIQKLKRGKIIRIRCFVSLLLVLCIGVIMAGCQKKVSAPVYDEELEPVEEMEVFGVVTQLDEVNGSIVICSIGYGTETALEFTKGADIRDKYGDIMPISNVKLGSIVDVVYDANRNKLVSLYITDKENVSKVEEISGAVFDYLENTVRMNGTTYYMSDDVRAFSDNVEIGINEICSEDQLTVWMYNDKVCSLYVELGHGYVKLSDYASYMGGMVEIGYDVIVPVTEDMLLTVREGTYNLRIAKGDDVGTKRVEVIKNQEINVSLADIAIEPKQTGSVLFKVTPADASVYIDGKRANTEGAIELIYGKHKINIIAKGYKSYSATFSVGYAYKIKEYNLEKEGENEADSTKKTTESTSKTERPTTQNDTTAQSDTTTKQEKQESVTTETDSGKDENVKDVSTTTGKKTANKVTISAPLGVSVYFDGEYLGVAPISFTKVTGSHIITFSQTGYLSKSYTVHFSDDGEDVTLRYDDLISIASLME